MGVPALADDINTEIIQNNGQLSMTIDQAAEIVRSLHEAGVIESSATSLVLTDPTLSYEKYEALGRCLGIMNRACSWWVGDWLIFGEGVYGEKFAQAASETGLAEQTLLNRAYVSRNVPADRRRAGLPFSVHAEVAPMSAKEQRYWLDKAERHGWTRADLRNAMKAKRKDDKPPMLSDGDDDAEQIIEVAKAILRDAVAHIDGQNHLVPNEDIARLRGALAEED